MKASDTVTSLFEMDRIGLTQWEQDLIQRHKAQQAEISFKLRTEDILRQLNGFNQRGLTITEAIALLQ